VRLAASLAGTVLPLASSAGSSPSASSRSVPS